jgi:hypothetical protein
MLPVLAGGCEKLADLLMEKADDTEEERPGCLGCPASDKPATG